MIAIAPSFSNREGILSMRAALPVLVHEAGLTCTVRLLAGF